MCYSDLGHHFSHSFMPTFIFTPREWPLWQDAVMARVEICCDGDGLSYAYPMPIHSHTVLHSHPMPIHSHACTSRMPSWRCSIRCGRRCFGLVRGWPEIRIPHSLQPNKSHYMWEAKVRREMESTRSRERPRLRVRTRVFLATIKK